MSKLKKALAKAKIERGGEDANFVKNGNRYKAENLTSKIPASNYRSELDISYSETKVKKIDSHILKKGKIISLFHDIDKIDQIKTLRTQVLNHLNQIDGNSILITSPNPYEGKTFTAINLGVSIAQELDRSVLLVDADLRKHTKYHKDFAVDFFGTDMTEGLSNYLLGKRTALLKVTSAPLRFII